MTNLPTTARSSAHHDIVENELSYMIVGGFFEVYNELGCGFTEPIYSRALQVVLQQKGILVEREVLFTVQFRGVVIGQHRVDMLVERRIVIEIKATERVADVAKRQVRNYLSGLKLELGILLHFGPRAEYYRILRPKA